MEKGGYGDDTSLLLRNIDHPPIIICIGSVYYARHTSFNKVGIRGVINIHDGSD